MSQEDEAAKTTFLLMHPLQAINFEVASGASTTSASLHLKNNMTSRVAFKIKSTMPDAYFVRPAVGVLEAQASQEVIITMKISHIDSVQKHKFSIQSKMCELEPSDTAAITSMWASSGKTGVQQVILRVTVTECEPRTPITTPTDPEAASPSKEKFSELTKQHVPPTQQTLTAQRAEVEEQLSRKREALSAQGQSQFTAMQVIMVLLLGVIAGLMLFR